MEMNQRWKAKRHKARAEAHIEPAEQIAEGSLKICEKENGTFQVKFVAKFPGTYKVDVIINGETLTQSPLTVLVMEPGKTS